MADIKELFGQYQTLQRNVSAGEESLDKKKTELSGFEKGLSSVKSDLSETETALRDAISAEMERKRELLAKADGMLEDGNFKEAYSLLTGKTLQEVVRYVLMPRTGTYAKGVHALREACKAEGNSVHPTFTQDDGSKIFRPLALKGDLEAGVNNYETLENPDGSKRTREERLKLFNTNTWLDSCTGIANKKKSTKFKVVPVCRELILIDENFDRYFLPVDYESVDGTELDSSKGEYNHSLTGAQVLEHSGWRAAVEEDLTLLKTFRDIVSVEKGNPEKLMGFYVRSKTDEDQLRALFVNNLGNGSDASGYNFLDSSGSFLRVAQEMP